MITESDRVPFRDAARLQFAEVVRELAPSVLEDLAERSLSEYRRLVEQALGVVKPRPGFPSPEVYDEAWNRFLEEKNEAECVFEILVLRTQSLDDRHALKFVESRPPPLTWELLVTDPRWAVLHREVEGWADRWGLGAEWCVDLALRTLALWVIFEGALEERRWSEASNYVEDRTENTLTLKGFLPDGRESIADFKKRVRCELDREIEETEKLAGERDWARGPSGSDPSAYMRLAKYQVLGETYETVAGLDTAPPAVHKAVKRLAKFLQLPLRRQIGRPTTRK